MNCPRHMESGLFNHNTRASLPGNLTPSRGRYLYYYGIGNWMASLLPPKAKDWPLVGDGVRNWLLAKEHLTFGCLNPAMILDAKKGLVATFTDLDAGGGSVPVILIYRERIDLITHKVRKGDRFAAASIYFQTPESRAKGQWNMFDPIIVDCLVPNRKSCQEATSRIKPMAWRSLEIGLSQIPDLTTLALHHVDVPDDVD